MFARHSKIATCRNMNSRVIFICVTFRNGNVAICITPQRTVVTWIINIDIGIRHDVMSRNLTN
jgi:hypothetical protein